MEDPIVSDVVIENLIDSVYHDDSMLGTGRENDPLGVNRDKFLPQNDLLNFRDVGWGLSTLNIVAQNNMGGMIMLTKSGAFAGRMLLTTDNFDPVGGANYNTLDVCAMNSSGLSSGILCRLAEGETQGTVELFATKELPADDDSNFVASTHWVQKALQNLGGDGAWGSLLVKTSTGYKWTDVLERGIEILTRNIFGTPMLRMSAGGENAYTFFIQQTGLELSMRGGRYSIKFPTEGGTLATVENINEAVGNISNILDYINGEAI